MTDKLKEYGKSKNGNFEVIDTIGVPHSYCITPKHMLPDHMFMNAETIKEAEETNGAVCDICRKINKKDYSKPILKYDEHKQALLVACYVDIEEAKQELTDYLFSNKERAIKDGYEGFAFMKKKKRKS